MLFKRMGYKSPRNYRAVNHPPPDEWGKKSEKVNNCFLITGAKRK